MPRLITLPFLAVLILVVVGLLKTPVTLALGDDVVGHIDEVRPSRRAGAHRFDIVYSYKLGNGSGETGSGTINTAGAPPPIPGQTVPLGVLRIGSFHRTELRDGDVRASGYICGGLFVLVWGGFIILFSIGVWLGPKVERNLIRDGNVTEGIVTGKQHRPDGRNTRYEILYRFRGGANEDRSAIQRVTPAQYAQVSEGQTVTVFYDASPLTLSRLYEASDFAVPGVE